MRRLAISLAWLALTGCLTTSAGEQSHVTLLVSFSTVPAIVRQSPNSWFAQITLSGGDLERPLVATARGLAGDDADLTLTTTSGGPRRLTITWFFYTGETVEAWTHARSDLYLTPGDQVVEAPLVRSPEFILEGTITHSGELPTQVHLKDLSTGLNFPAVQVEDLDGSQIAFTINHVPVGRFFLLQVRDASGGLHSFDDCPVFSSRSGTHSFEGDLDERSCTLE